MKFQVGDRVIRPKDVYKRDSPIKHGTVSRRYSAPKKVYLEGDLILGPYPELYEVQWDDGSTGKGFLPHGLDRE